MGCEERHTEQITPACPACPYEIEEQRQRSNRIAFIMQTSYNPRIKIYTARCASCGKTYRKIWWWFLSEDEVLEKLLRKFAAKCHSCKGWICRDCYMAYIEDSSIGICAKCLRERGVRGLNMRQYNTMLKKIMPLSSEQVAKNQKEFFYLLRDNEKEKTGNK